MQLASEISVGATHSSLYGTQPYQSTQELQSTGPFSSSRHLHLYSALLKALPVLEGALGRHTHVQRRGSVARLNELASFLVSAPVNST